MSIHKSEVGEKRMCDEIISASVGTTPKVHAPTRTYNLERHLGHLQPKILKLVQLCLEHQ